MFIHPVGAEIRTWDWKHGADVTSATVARQKEMFEECWDDLSWVYGANTSLAAVTVSQWIVTVSSTLRA